MPFITHRGQRIHYTVEGAGPLLILQHGLLMDAESWRRNGVAGALASRFRVACIDSLGHGLSDKPGAAALYGQAQRAGDIVAVMDALGADRAHLIGYSMGAWLAVGVAKHHRDRLASLVIGGWNLVEGAYPGLRFDALMAYAAKTTPGLIAWITPALRPGVQASFDALSELSGASDAVLHAGVPVMLWNGRTDPYHDPMKAYAASHALPFTSSEGDHLTAILHPDAATLRALDGFLDAAEAKRGR